MLRTAKLAGENWYLRSEQRGRADGLVRYELHCVPEGATAPVLLEVLCAVIPGPERCRAPGGERSYARLDRAADEQCSPDALR